MPLSTQEIKEILRIIEDSGWDEAQVQIGDVLLSLSKREGGSLFGPTPPASSGAPAPAATNGSDAAPAPPVAEAAEPSGTTVESPSVGVFWRSPEPGAPPFVEVGAHVATGDRLCIVEVMKLMQDVIAEEPGVVVAIHPDNGDSVEFGSPLMTIAPDV